VIQPGRDQHGRMGAKGSDDTPGCDGGENRGQHKCDARQGGKGILHANVAIPCLRFLKIPAVAHARDFFHPGRANTG